MATQKEIQSKINLEKATLEQIKTSHHYKDDERKGLIKKSENRLEELAKLLEVK